MPPGTMVRSDEELLRSWRRGDNAAGSQLFERYFEALYRFFCNKADEQMAFDLQQQTMMACVKGKDRIRDTGKFSAHLFRIAYHTLMKSLRAKYRARSGAVLEELSITELGITPAERMARKAEQRLLLKALRALPITDQVVLELFYWERLRRRELAQVLGIGESAAAGRIHRARQRLKEAIAQSTADPELGYRTTADFEKWLNELRARTPDIRRTGVA